jgi:hypothetical protein
MEGSQDITPWGTALLDKPKVLQSLKNSPHFMQPEVSLPCAQQPATCPILSQMNPVHTFPFYFLNIHYKSILSSKLTSSNWFLPAGFSTKILRLLGFLVQRQQV